MKSVSAHRIYIFAIFISPTERVRRNRSRGEIEISLIHLRVRDAARARVESKKRGGIFVLHSKRRVSPGRGGVGGGGGWKVTIVAFRLVLSKFKH